MATHYETLGVEPGASAAQIRQAYLRRARALHPDRQLGRPPAEAAAAARAMQQVNLAWGVLSDTERRAAYDLRHRPAPTASARAAQAPSRARQPQSVRPRIADEPVGRAIDEQAGDGSVSVWASVPVLVVIGLLLGVLIITAFADREPADNRPVIQPNAAQLTVGDCFAFVGDDPRPRSCTSGTADGQVVAIGASSGNCPQNSAALRDPTSDLYLCWVRMIPGSANTTGS